MNRPKILCVDDDADVLEGLRDTLRGSFDVHTHTDARSALDELHAPHAYSVVLSDMRMPRINGVEFLREARVAAPNATRVMLTGHASISTAINAVNQGVVYRFLTKPCEPNVLRGALTAAVAEHERTLQAVAHADERSREQFEKLERLAALGIMAGSVGHEMNNALMVARGCTSFLEDGHHADPSILEDLQHAVRHLEVHAKNLLHLARPTPNDSSRSDLHAAIERTVRLLKSAGLARGVTFDLRLDETPTHVALDVTRLEQVLINLIKNAIEATESIAVPRRVELSTMRVENRTLCSVRDNGCGMDREQSRRIFTPFYSAKGRARGMGLGLSVVRQILESARGAISVTSRLGEGTEFTFHLPDAPVRSTVGEQRTER